MLKVFVATVVVVARAVFCVALRAGRVVPVRAARDIVAPDAPDATGAMVMRRPFPIAVRVIVVSRVRVVVVRARCVTAARVAVRDAASPSRVAAPAAEFARDKESVPRTAADDAPNDSAIVIIKTVIPFISFKDKVSKK